MRAWIVLLLMLPSVAADIENPQDAYDARLYLHVDGMQDIRLHALAPPRDFRYEESAGGLSQSGCVETPGQRFSSQQRHTWYAVVAPGYIDYGSGFGPSPLAERGIRDDLVLVNESMVLEWFVRTGTAGSDQGIAPQVMLTATMREGGQITVDDQGYNRGRIIAQASTQPADLTPALEGHPEVEYDAEAEVYRFRLELDPRTPLVVPERESFNLRLDVFVRNPYCASPDAYAMPDLVRVVSYDTHRPTLTMTVREPVRIERLSANVLDDAVVLEARLKAVFGVGDAILRADALLITGPSTASNQTSSWGDGKLLDGRAFPERAKGGYILTTTWATGADGATGGPYNASLAIRTESGATATASVPFAIGDKQQSCTVMASGAPSCTASTATNKATPGLVAALPLLVAALLRRR